MVKTLLLSVVLTLALGVTVACGGGPEERTCGLYYTDFHTIYALERSQEALVELRKLSTEMEEVAHEAEPDIAEAVRNMKGTLMAAEQVVTKETFDATGVLEVACDKRGYDYDHFFPNAPRR